MRAAVSLVAVTSVVAAVPLAGPFAAGMIAAFPALSATLVIVIAKAGGTRAAGRALVGLVAGLGGFLCFSVIAAVAAPQIGVALAVPLALGACSVAYRVAWRAVPAR
jgi:hypothetical protein